MVDVFNFLYESRRVLLEGKLTVSWPLARRAYESLSLMALCYLDESYARKWESGARIQNSEIRKQLAKHPMGESEGSLGELYRFFSQASHSNRELVPYRYLGEGSKFVLGAIGVPELLLVVDHCIKHVGLWFWFGAVVSFVFHKAIKSHDASYHEKYSQTAERAQKVNEWLAKQFNHLLEERAKSPGEHK